MNTIYINKKSNVFMSKQEYELDPENIVMISKTAFDAIKTQENSVVVYDTLQQALVEVPIPTPEISLATAHQFLKQERDYLLGISDWVALPDCESDSTLVSEILYFRSQIRRIDSSENNTAISTFISENERAPRIFDLITLSVASKRLLKII